MNKIVVAVNRLTDKITELSVKVDNLAKSPAQQLNAKYLNNEETTKILHISNRTLTKIRTDGTLKYTKIRRRILYEASDVDQYLKNNSRRHS